MLTPSLKQVMQAGDVGYARCGIYAASQTVRSNVPANQHEFRILFAGIIIIDGLCAAFLMPYFTSHEKIYG